MSSAAIGFVYSPGPHRRRHGPAGYGDYESYRDWLRDEFSFRCVYCLQREQWGIPLGNFDIDHFVPQSIDTALGCTYANLLYLCHACNLKKGHRRLPDPCVIALDQCICVREDGAIEALDRVGRKIIRTLALEDPKLVEWRARLIAIFKMLCDNPPLLKQWLGYPADLPDLSLKRPVSNNRPAGIDESYFALRTRGLLPDIY